MSDTQTALRGSNIPITPESEPRIASLRMRLQNLFGELCLVRDIITVSVEAMHAQASEFDADVSRVLFRCGAEKLYGQLESLSDIIEQFGGRTELTVGRERDRVTSAGEVNHAGA